MMKMMVVLMIAAILHEAVIGVKITPATFVNGGTQYKSN